MSIFSSIKKSLFSNDFIFNSFKRIVKHDKTKYNMDFFEKNKYNKYLNDSFFKYENTTFYYYINTSVKSVYSKHLVDNISISYSDVVNKSLNSILNGNTDEKFVKFIHRYFDKIKKEIELKNNDVNNEIIKSVNNFFESSANDFKDALQRILFINQLLWQTGHRLNGLGRLDLTLNDIYTKSNISKEDAKGLIKDFLTVLHKDYYYKSNELKGDTGQIIIIGGLNPDGSYFSNDLSYLFIEAVKELYLPDPKTLLRVSEKLPNDLLKLGIDSIKTGCGSPLLSNDDIIIDKLVEIGYTKEDASNYATSACWEPLCDGKSFEQNNIADLNFVQPLNKLLDEKTSFDNFNGLVDEYLKYLKTDIESTINEINSKEIAYDPLISSFISNCVEDKKDISKGGAKYNNYGVLTSGLGNLIDSLINIKLLVFDTSKYNLVQLIDAMNNNFLDENIYNDLKSNNLKYGSDDELVIELTNKIIDYTNNEFAKYNNKFGGIFRFGLSSPNYIKSSSKIKASLDGRKDYMPFNVHISSTGNISYTEIINFASKLHYGIRNVNGNVCDLIVAPSIIDNNYDKFLSFIKIAIKQGFFQIQFNVLDSKTLIEAKNNPDKFKNLIVRVWGFSAYFIELPENYQDLLIRRAIQSELAS